MAAGDASGEGDVRFRMTDANRGIMTKVFESRTEPLDVSTDPRQQLIIPMSGAKVGQDDLIVFELEVDADTTFDYGLSTVRIPITVLALATGQKTATYLTHKDFRTSDMTPLAANGWAEVGSYTVPAQQEVRLGHEIPDNSRLYINITTTA